MELKIGISMRVTQAQSYVEERDTIARDWSHYMLTAFPQTKWLFLPNIGASTVSYLQNWGINVLILSGGDDLGVYAQRDRSELALLKYALGKKIPVIGVCRGMQLLVHNAGGTIQAGSSSFIQDHRATRHNIIIDGQTRSVNSYHNNYVAEHSLPEDFTIRARCPQDGSVEAVTHRSALGLMWHPEREPTPAAWETTLLHNFILQQL